MEFYAECITLEANSFDTDPIGHPLSDKYFCDVRLPFVQLKFYELKDDPEDKDLARARQEWANVHHPVMACGNIRCVNPDHMVWGRKNKEGQYQHAYDPNYIIYFEEYFQSRREQQSEISRGKIGMARVEGIRKDIRSMTEDELKDLVSGKRKYHREVITQSTTTKKAKSRVTKKSKMEDTLDQLGSLPADATEALLKKLTGG